MPIKVCLPKLTISKIFKESITIVCTTRLTFMIIKQTQISEVEI